MKKIYSLPLMIGITGLILAFAAISIVHAGSALDFGQLTGIPAQVNYIAWVPLFTPPTEILTEDGYNSNVGVNQGYQGGVWRLNPSNMTNPPPIPNFNINMIFGGLGSANNTLWTFNFPWVNTVPDTDHGIVGSTSTGSCPIMLPGSQTPNDKTINWQGPNSEYLVYRAILPSGANNGASNGRYALASTIPSGTFTYVDTTCGTNDPTPDCWHIVVPSNGGVPNGCHSEESNPTAITLTQFTASNTPSNNVALWVGIGISLLAIAGLVLVWNRKRA